jgi:hypothetical protein
MSKTTLEVVDRRECTQVEFVEILKNGLDALNTIYQQCSSNNMQEV